MVTLRFSVAALFLLQHSDAFQVPSSTTPRHDGALSIMPDQAGAWFQSERFREHRDDRSCSPHRQQERRPNIPNTQASRPSPAELKDARRATARRNAERMRAMYQQGMEEDIRRSVRKPTVPRPQSTKRDHFGYQPSGGASYRTKQQQPLKENRQYRPRQRPTGYQEHQASSRTPYYPYEDVLGRGMPRYPNQPERKEQRRQQEQPQRQGHAPPANEKPNQRSVTRNQWMELEPPMRSERNKPPQYYEEHFQDPPIGNSWKEEQAGQGDSSPSLVSEPAKVAAMLTQANKRILIEELGYRRADVKKLKFDLALGLVQDRIPCPKEGVPDSWFTSTATHLKP